jgi:hypothetical protein
MCGNLTSYKDACSLAQAKGLPSLIYHQSALEARFVHGAAGTTSFLTMRGNCTSSIGTELKWAAISFRAPSPTVDPAKLENLGNISIAPSRHVIRRACLLAFQRLLT